MAADTQEEAARLFTLARDVAAGARSRGLFARCPRRRKPRRIRTARCEHARVERLRARAIYGTPDVVGGKLRALAAEHGVEEIAILTTLHDPEARRRSYTLLAKECGLEAPMPLAAWGEEDVETPPSP